MMRTVSFALWMSVLSLSSAGAWEQSVSKSGAALHRTANCADFYLHEMGSNDIDSDGEFDAIKASLDEWSNVDCSSMTFQYAGLTNYEITGYTGENPVVNVILFREKKWPYTQRPVAFTSVTYDPVTGVIVDADIELNGEDYYFTVTPDLQPWKVDVQNTVTHELGHTVGLNHTELPDSTMFAHAGPGETNKRTLADDDKAGVCTIYPVDQGQLCPVTTPKFLEVEFFEEPPPGGCSAIGPASPPLSWVVLLLVFAALRVRRCRP